MSDLSKLKPTKNTIEVILKDPNTGEVLMNDDETEMSVTVYAPWTSQYRAAGFNRANERLKGKKDPKNFDFTFEELESAGIDLLIDVTVDWDITYDGKKPKFEESLAREIYREFFWIKSQIEEDINNSGDFTKA